MPGPLLSRIPLIGKHLFSNEYVNKLTPTALQNLGQTYRNVIGLGNNPAFASGAFKQLDQQRISDNDEVPVKTKGPYGASILDKINDKSNPDASQAAKEVKNKIAEALVPRNAYDKAMKKFNENSATFKDLIKQIPGGNFGAEDVIGTFKYYIDKSRTAIVAQQDLDKQMLAAQFDNKDFKDNVMKAYSIDRTDPDADKRIGDLKTNMLKELSASHKKQLGEFDKSTAEAINKLHQASAEEYKQMGLIETLRRANADNVAMLEQIAEANRAKHPVPANASRTGIGTYTETDIKAKLAYVKLEDINKPFKSMTGMEIEQIQPGVFKFHFSMISPRYYQSLAQKPLTDFLLVSQLIKAQGNDKITWTIEIENKEALMERAKQAVEGAVRAGFELGKIEIRDKSGRELKIDELFKDDPESYKRISQRAAEIKQELSGMTPPEVKSAKNDTVKAAIKDIKEQYKVNPPPKEQEEEQEVEEDRTRAAPK